MNNIFSGQANSNTNLNPHTRDMKTVLLAASALFIFGSFVGCALYRLLGIGESELYDKLIERYFLALFYKCEGTIDVMRVAAECCIHELWMFVAVFLGGFTLFAPFIGGVLLLYRGVLFGFALTMLQFSNRTGLLLDSMVYLFAMFALSMLLTLLASRAVCHYFYERSPKLKSPYTKNYILAFFRITAIVCADVVLMLFLIYVYI